MVKGNTEKEQLTDTITVRFTREEKARISEMADNTYRDNSKVIRMMVHDYLSRLDRGEVEFR
ncbi:MAG: hypothetical protein JW885_02480 [Deltaproteobacteria bacterium]|nr:hypothetical protein [Candidatus Zymogenaceae bacterium]